MNIEIAQTESMTEFISRFQILPESIAVSLMFARTSEPHRFVCRVCGEEYYTTWVALAGRRGLCDGCNERRRSGGVQSSAAGYEMPPMYARDGSVLMPEIAAWLSAPLPALAILHGGPGRGKSCQAHHIGAWSHKARLSFRIISDRDLIRPDDRRMDEWTDVGVLVVDEVGRRSGEAAVANIVDLLDRRLPYDMKTALITNMAGKEIAALDARLLSRIRSSSTIGFPGPDLRSKGGQSGPARGS